MNNKIYIYVIVDKKSKKMIPEEWELRNLNNQDFPKNLKTIMAFKSRRTANRWVNYWRDGKNHYRVIAVGLDISPLGELII